jgi:nucleotide-binding universal stress UspA family protein
VWWHADGDRTAEPIEEGGPTMSTGTSPIVVGVDGSPSSLAAVDWAVREAHARQRPLRIVHAFLWPLYDVPLGPSVVGPAEAGLQHAAEHIVSTAVDRARQTAPTVELSTDMPVRAPAAALIAESAGAHLIVVGHRGLGGFAGLLLGSVGVQTAAHASCPVVVVRDSEGGRDHASEAAGHVVVGVDGSAPSSLAIDFAFSHAAHRGLGVVAVQAYPPSGVASSDPRLAAYADDERHDAQRRRLAEILEGHRDKFPDTPVTAKMLPGTAAAVLVQESADAVLTVVGSRGRGGFAGLLLGSTSQSLLHHATGPVAIVRARSTGCVPSQPLRRSQQDPQGMFQQSREIGQKQGAGGAVEDTVVD